MTIALGVFALAVVAIVGILPQLMRQAAASNELLVAQRFPDAVRSEMRRVATGSFDSFAASIPVNSAATGGYQILATRDGARISSAATNDGVLNETEAFFSIELWRFSDPPLAFVPGQTGSLAVLVRVSWPYRLPGSVASTDLEDRQQFSFATAINR
ncbi:MAG TPA: hypothetical protein VG710_08415 [Opitutus sp.]|nr:hypothetical protein [Opitutus sp.]